jgi:hypothetical protein
MSRHHQPGLPPQRPQQGVLLTIPSGSTLTAVAGTGSVTTGLVGGAVPPGSPLVWPLVVLALGSMAYDLGVRALHRMK